MTSSLHLPTKFLEVLTQSGLTHDQMADVVAAKSTGIPKAIVDLIRGLTAGAAISTDTARRVLGEGYFGLEEIEKLLSVRLSIGNNPTLGFVPFRLETLQSSKDSHLLVAGTTLSLLELIQLCPGTVSADTCRSWLSAEPFASRRLSAGWFLIRKDATAHANRNWRQQRERLRPSWQAARCTELVLASTLYHRRTGRRLWISDSLRSVDQDSLGLRVVVGPSRSDGLLISYADDAKVEPNLGIGQAQYSD